MKLKDRYNLNAAAKTGETLICPSCHTSFTKTNYQQKFCKSKTGTQCKDKYWNTVTPTKRNNTTRISPASAVWMAKQKSKPCYTNEGYQIVDGVAYDELGYPVYDVDHGHDDHPFSSEALGQW